LLEFSNTFTSPEFDHIITNPPFFNNSLKASIAERSNARHTDLLSFEMLASATNRLLKPEGKLSLVLPVNEGKLFTDIAKENHLFLTTSLIIVPKTGKPANRMLMQFEKTAKPAFTDELLIREVNGEFTTAYKNLTGDFYLNF
jgi:tRNA1Val (adenine37-N6)-methyltransferase